MWTIFVCWIAMTEKRWTYPKPNNLFMALIRPKEMRLHNQSRHINFYDFPFYGYSLFFFLLNHLAIAIAFAIHKPRIDIYSIFKIIIEMTAVGYPIIFIFSSIWFSELEQWTVENFISFFFRWHKFVVVLFIVFRQVVLAIKPFFFLLWIEWKFRQLTRLSHHPLMKCSLYYLFFLRLSSTWLKSRTPGSVWLTLTVDYVSPGTVYGSLLLLKTQ